MLPVALLYHLLVSQCAATWRAAHGAHIVLFVPGVSADFACGVVTAEGRHVLVDNGSLPAAVTASAAIPVVFRPVDIPGGVLLALLLALLLVAACTNRGLGSYQNTGIVSSAFSNV